MTTFIRMGKWACPACKQYYTGDRGEFHEPSYVPIGDTCPDCGTKLVDPFEEIEFARAEIKDLMVRLRSPENKDDVIERIKRIMDFSSKDWSLEKEDWAIYQLVHPVGIEEKPVVINIHRFHGIQPKFDIYIGRRVQYQEQFKEDSKWHNPFSKAKYGEESLRLFEMYARALVFPEKIMVFIGDQQIAVKNAIQRSKERFGSYDLSELTGKRLGCWCKPAKCHGDIWVKLWKEKMLGGKK